ncbi:MAG: molybdopterin/thiamine biosynthesis adenylyltransferase [Alphaproteobacteria bacterium]|jgi:molybdopterin/thiamine biosynthesis adenylyltransferase
MTQLHYQNIEKFSRQIMLPTIGNQGQEKLSKSHIVVVGCGGLGCPTLLYLAASGIGKITLIDNDTISTSNLHRQILFSAHDVGYYKAEIAAQKLAILHPDTTITPIIKRLDTQLAKQYCRDADLVIDGTDSFLSKYILGDITHKLLVASVVGMRGYIAGFTNKMPYRGFFPNVPDNAPNCSQTGVLGSVAGMIGCLVATEAIKIIINHHYTSINKVINIDLERLYFNVIKLPTHMQTSFNPLPCLEFITFDKLTSEIIIDIREPKELTGNPLIEGAQSMPLSRLNIDNLLSIPNFILKCHTGRRAEQLALKLALSDISLLKTNSLRKIKILAT